MSNNKISNEVTCRICLSNKIVNDQQSYFDLTQANQQLLQRYNFCFQLNLNAEKLLNNSAHHLCSDCKSKVDFTFDFIQKAQHFHKLLEESDAVTNKNVENNDVDEVNDNADNNSDDVDDAETVFMLDEELELLIDYSNQHFADSDDVNVSSDETVFQMTKQNSNPSSTQSYKMENDKAENKLFYFPCQLCSSIYDYERKLMEHYENDHAFQDATKLHFICDKCPFRYATKNTLTMHQQQVHEQISYADCKMCGRSLKESDLKMHWQKIHKCFPKYVCSQCDKSFQLKKLLIEHIRKMHKPRMRNFVCNICNMKFFTSTNLREHKLIHDTPQWHKCPQCNREFLQKSMLKNHMRLHLAKGTACEYCGKKFTVRKDLEIHKRYHTRDYPYVCAICGMKFPIVSQLNYHEKKHMGVRYKCKECEQIFGSMSSLKLHTFKHIGMPVQCILCKRGFASRSKTLRHLGCVHAELFADSNDGCTAAKAEKYMCFVPKPRNKSKEVALMPVRDNNATNASKDLSREQEQQEEYLLEQIMQNT